MLKQESGNEELLYNRVADHITRLIDQGTLHAGERLPSVRKLSSQMDVSISTVLQAYMILEDKEWIEAKPQSGFYVRPARNLPPEPKPSTPAPVVTRVGVSELVAQVFQSAHVPDLVQLALSTPSPEHLPVKRLNRLMAAATSRSGARALSYDFPPGYAPLRHEIAKRSLDSGCQLAESEIVSTNGTMEALNLCLRAVAKSGDVIAIESPAFYGTLQVIESLGMRALEIPTDPRDGIILSALDSAMRRQRIKACLFVTNFSNPLGSCMPDGRKKELVELLARREIPLIEDDIYGDLCFGDTRPRAAKAYDKKGLVLLCSSFSKTLAPGYRVGWTAPGRFKPRVESLKFTSSMATATAPQMAIADFLQSGGYDRYLRKLRRILMTQVQQMSSAVGKYFPEGTKVTRPQGGYVLWVELPRAVDSIELHRRALERKISIAPGPIFSPKQRYKNFIRLSCGLPWSEKIDRAVRELGDLALNVQ
ncbi:MAG TPA: PLP-dependent aminotransferase family protein [Candidatus Binatia bacterium]|nr:PLP-dependent aminotransferase family protein [Candidatus Binatia bacterium]